MAAAARQHEEPLAFIANRELFGDLIDSPVFVAAYTQALHDLHHIGARAALEALIPFQQGPNSKRTGHPGSGRPLPLLLLKLVAYPS